MAVHVATLGWDHPSRILPSLLQEGKPEHVYLVCSADDAEGGHAQLGASIGGYLVEQLKQFMVPSSIHEVPPFDATELVTHLVRLEQQHGSSVHLNITGGTKIMVVGAMMYAMTSQRVSRIYYASAKQYGTQLPDRKMKVEEISSADPGSFVSHGFNGNFDVPRIGHVDLLREHVAATILRQLLIGQLATIGDLAARAANEADVSLNTARDRIRELREARILEVKTEGRTGKPSLTSTGRQLAKLVDVVTA